MHNQPKPTKTSQNYSQPSKTFHKGLSQLKDSVNFLSIIAKSIPISLFLGVMFI